MRKAGIVAALGLTLMTNFAVAKSSESLKKETKPEPPKLGDVINDYVLDDALRSCGTGSIADIVIIFGKEYITSYRLMVRRGHTLKKKIPFSVYDRKTKIYYLDPEEDGSYDAIEDVTDKDICGYFLDIFYREKSF